MDYDVYAMEYYYEHDVHMLDTVAHMVRGAYGVRAYVDYDSRTVTVYDVDMSTLSDLVSVLGTGVVHDMSYDYDYGYDEYLDPLEVADDRVVLYCGVALYSVD